MDFVTVENALLAAINAGLVDTGVSYLGQPAETYAGQLEGDIETLLINYPTCFVVFDGSALSWVDGPTYNEDDTFTVFCCSNDVRGNIPLREDSVSGVNRMIKDVLRTLSGNNLGLDIEKLQPLRVYPVLITKTLAIYGVKFKTNFDSQYT